MASNPLASLSALGQSVWLDTIRRGLLTSGEFARLVEANGLLGVTSNPSIFEKAIAESSDYDDAIRALAASGKSSAEICETLMIEDIRRGADLLRAVYERLEGRDGFVSLEVAPRLAHDTAASIAEARRLWKAVDRPNLMIKIPATAEGVPAVRALLAEGINVNVTLLFGLSRYREVAQAYLAGLEARAQAGGSLERLASVASFFLSRIDSLLDPELEKLMRGSDPRAQLAKTLHGQVAIGCARAAYGIYEELFGSERFRRLAAAGARTQRLLWASTSTKNPAYSDVMYVEALVYPATVNTLPLETIAAYRDHGHPAALPAQSARQARDLLERLPELGIDLEAAARRLEGEGVEKFVAAQDLLLGALERKRAAVGNTARA
jgi:transaldolase